MFGPSQDRSRVTPKGLSIFRLRLVGLSEN
jgi:hypothetical protein